MDTKATFEVGKTYSAQAIGDSDCHYVMTVVSRTDKTAMVLREGEKKPRRYKIHSDHHYGEFIRMGTWSMASSWYAHRFF